MADEPTPDGFTELADGINLVREQLVELNWPARYCGRPGHHLRRGHGDLGVHRRNEEDTSVGREEFQGRDRQGQGRARYRHWTQGHHRTALQGHRRRGQLICNVKHEPPSW